MPGASSSLILPVVMSRAVEVSAASRAPDSEDRALESCARLTAKPADIISAVDAATKAMPRLPRRSARKRPRSALRFRSLPS